MATNTTTASQPNAAPSERNAVLGSEAARAIRRAVKYLKENGCTGPAADLEALLAAPALPEPAAALDNTAIRKILHKYSRHMGQPDYYSDTEFACLQDVIAFAKEIAALASASPQPLAEVSAAQAVPGMSKERITAIATEMAVNVAKNASVAPQLCFPHIYLGLTELFAAAPVSQPTDTTREA